MIISGSSWGNYINRLRKVNDAAADKMTEYLQTHDVITQDERKQMLDYAYGLATYYGEGAAELACQMYDAAAKAQGASVPPAEPAETATYGETAKAVQGTMKYSDDPKVVGSSVGRLVKMAGVDTTMKNAIRDRAEWAWIPSGDTCAFCLTLASRGFQKASKKVLKGNHAEHIHANCDCTFFIRFDGKSTIEGYEPEKLRAEYYAAEGSTPQEKINSMRRANRQLDKDRINAQKRIAEEKKRQLSFDENNQLVFQRKGLNIKATKTVDGEYGIYVSENATLKKQGLKNIEKAIKNSLKDLHVDDNKTLPQIIVLADKEMGDVYASYNYVGNLLYFRDSMGDKRKTIAYQTTFGFADPKDPKSTAKHELIHWLDADNYRTNIEDITGDNSQKYLQYRNEQSKIKLSEVGIDENNVNTISMYAFQQYILNNDFDEAYTEYRVIKGY